eukprot:5999948-Amphidinium_carterae.1
MPPCSGPRQRRGGTQAWERCVSGEGEALCAVAAQSPEGAWRGPSAGTSAVESLLGRGSVICVCLACERAA